MTLPLAGDGTFASFAGYPLARCTFQRSRGWASSPTVVEILTTVLLTGASAAGFEVHAPRLEALFSRDLPTPPPGRRLAGAVEAAGQLVLREVVGGEVWEVSVGPLYVVRAEEVRRADGSPVGRVRLSLEDVRYFWSRGLLRRWSYNRRLASGGLALDSVQPTGDPVTLGQIAQEAAAALPSSPRLERYPAEWDRNTQALELPRFGAAAAALAGIEARAGLEEPCLRLDGSLALHEPGDGRVGYSLAGEGPNTFDLPPWVVLDKNGQGRGRTIEPGYPEEFTLVVGGPRIVSVAVDDWQPVVQLPDGRIRALTEGFMRALTRDALGLEWLAKFVLKPSAYQHHSALAPDIAALLADQAYRVYRLPGAEVEADAGHAPRDPLLPQDAPEEGTTLTAPGPNAHLLPLLARAETVNGQRQAALVEAYSFTSEHVRLRGEGTPAQEELRIVQVEIGRIRANLPALPATTTPLAAATLQASDVFRGEEAELVERGVPLDTIEGQLVRVREIEQYRRAPGGAIVSDQLLELTRRKLAAEEAAGAEGGTTEVFEIARLIFAAELAIKEEAGAFDTATVGEGRDVAPPGAFDAEGLTVADLLLRASLARRESTRQALLSQIRPLLIRAEREREERRRRRETTGTEAVEEEAAGVVLYVNRPVGDGPRAVDTEARVIDAKAGLVRLSGLGGHVVPNGAADLSYAAFVPRAVRVTFGAVVRPRIDVPPEASTHAPPAPLLAGRTASPGGASFDAASRARLDDLRAAAVEVQPGGGQNTIPPDALSDRESYYVSAWRRVGRGSVEQVDPEQVPLDRAVRIDRPDMVELVRLTGASNLAELNADALQIARERANVRDVVESTRLVLARPWPVQCDGVVSSVTITMREKDGVPCGFETLVTTGSAAVPPVTRAGRTVVRPRDPLAGQGGAGALRAGTS